MFYLGTDFIKIFVLDEADEMLSRGFKEQIHGLFRSLPSDVQVILLSATMPEDVFEVTKKFMRDPVKILVKKEELTLEGIKQFYVKVEDDSAKILALIDLYNVVAVTQTVIFCNTRKRVNEVANCLEKHDFTVSVMVIKIDTFNLFFHPFTEKAL